MPHSLTLAPYPALAAVVVLVEAAGLEEVVDCIVPRLYLALLLEQPVAGGPPAIYKFFYMNLRIVI